MSRVSDRNLSPRNGHTLMAGLGARISGCADQKEESLNDQTDHNKEVVTDRYNGPIEYLIIATKGKGERLDRPELAEIESEFRKSYLDIFVWEDLGRLVRGVEAVRLLGIAVDHGIRVIVPNDNIDTADDTWEADAIKACADHVAHQQHTSRRLKHKLKNRFQKFGGAMSRPIAGYVVPEEAKTLGDWLKEGGAESWILDGAKMLRATLNCTAVADMLNARGIPTGKYCRRKSWDGAMVRRFYGNPLLKGMPARGVRHSVKLHETGRRKSVKNPKGPVYYACSHLAYFEEVEFDELQMLLARRNANFRRKSVNGNDPLLSTPRKRTRFPGQHGRCWYCGHQHVWGGNGVTENLMCGNSRQWQCWNSVGYNGELAVTRLMEAVTHELYRLDGFDDQYRELVEQAVKLHPSDLARRWERLQEDEGALAVKKQNFVDAIEKFGLQPMFDAKLQSINEAEFMLKVERRKLEQCGVEQPVIPASLMELRTMLEQEFVGATQDSPEFGDVLRKLCPDFFVYVVRVCDGNHLLPRARIRLALDGVIPDLAHVPGVDGLLRRDLTFDLFVPSQRERIRADAADWKAQGFGPKAIAAKIAEHTAERPTDTAVQNALSLDKRMRELGLESPYVLVTAPPGDCPRLRRHKNAKYRFVPLAGYVPPPLS